MFHKKKEMKTLQKIAYSFHEFWEVVVNVTEYDGHTGGGRQ